MAESRVFYTTDEERQAALTDAHDRGLVKLHENTGTGPDGENELVFDVPRPPRPPTERETALAPLYAKLADGTSTLADLVEMLKIERRL